MVNVGSGKRNTTSLCREVLTLSLFGGNHYIEICGLAMLLSSTLETTTQPFFLFSLSLLFRKNHYFHLLYG